MSLCDLFVAALAAWQVVEVWHHGDIFADWRSRVELWRGGVWGWLGGMLGCPWCLSVWVGLLVCAELWLASFAGYSWVALPAYALAVSRLANLGNDLSHARCRTPRVGRANPEGDPNFVIGKEGGQSPPSFPSEEDLKAWENL